jgi:hypothetical protein
MDQREYYIWKQDSAIFVISKQHIYNLLAFLK